MSRSLPTECDGCGEVVDWGDFGDDDFASECRCPIPAGSIDEHGDPIRGIAVAVLFSLPFWTVLFVLARSVG